jgi:cytochrome P450
MRPLYVSFIAGWTSKVAYSLFAYAQSRDLSRRRFSLFLQAGASNGRINDLPRLDAALQESMRYKPVGPVVIRRATADFSAPMGKSDLPLDICRGDSVVIDLANMHRDPRVFPNPSQFDIENFLGKSFDGGQQLGFRPFGDGRY